MGARQKQYLLITPKTFGGDEELNHAIPFHWNVLSLVDILLLPDLSRRSREGVDLKVERSKQNSTPGKEEGS